jgi:hypothetical protein
LSSCRHFQSFCHFAAVNEPGGMDSLRKNYGSAGPFQTLPPNVET